jgi:hypothetical protein
MRRDISNIFIIFHDIQGVHGFFSSSFFNHFLISNRTPVYQSILSKDSKKAPQKLKAKRVIKVLKPIFSRVGLNTSFKKLQKLFLGS